MEIPDIEGISNRQKGMSKVGEQENKDMAEETVQAEETTAEEIKDTEKPETDSESREEDKKEKKAVDILHPFEYNAHAVSVLV